MLEDGGVPPSTATIERICPGSVRAEGYTDSKGYFSVEIGNETGVFQDASETAGYTGPPVVGSSSGLGSSGGSRLGSSDQRYSACDLRAHLAGYRSQTVSLANRRPMDDPNIGVLLLHREGQEEGTTVSAVSLAAPHDAKHAFDRGLQAIKKGKTEEAEKEFQKAVTIYPHYATAWDELGHIQLERNQNDAARQSYQAAAKADPKFIHPYLQLSVIGMRESRWNDVIEATDQALKLDPFDFAMAWLYNGVAHWNLKDVDAAEKSIREADRLDSRHTLPEVSHLMGLILIQRRDFAGAAENLRLYLKLAPDASDAPKVKAQLEQAEKLVAQSATTPKQDQ